MMGNLRQKLARMKQAADSSSSSNSCGELGTCELERRL